MGLTGSEPGVNAPPVWGWDQILDADSLQVQRKGGKVLHAWIQGMRPGRPEDHQRKWQETIFDRVAGAFENVPSGVGTAASEKILDLDEHTYMFLDMVEPKYSEYLLAYRVQPRREVWGDFAVAPFDTGGIAQNHIPLTSHDLTPAEFVKQFTYTNRRFLSAFRRWIKAGYDDGLTGYVSRRPPKAHTVSLIDVSKTKDARAWNWEGRLRRRSYSKHPLPVKKVVFRPADRDEYERWVEENRSLSQDEANQHLARMDRLTVIVDAPALKMKAMLLGRGRRG